MAPSQGDLFCTRQLKLYLSIYYVIFLLSHIACDLLQRVLSILFTAIVLIRLLWWRSGEESACQCRRHGLDPWVRKICWRRRWQPPPVFLPGKSHGQKSVVGCCPRGCKRVGHDLATKQQQITGFILPVPFNFKVKSARARPLPLPPPAPATKSLGIEKKECKSIIGCLQVVGLLLNGSFIVPLLHFL